MHIKSSINIKLIFSFLAIFFYGLLNSLLGATENSYYRESVYLHLGRDTYIAGEKIWYKAYCRNQSEPELQALSKVIYVELINSGNNHVFGQILKTDNGSSESCFDLPDTLTSGLYFIKAYTQWMQNFGPETFFSQPVYIYNYFSENSENQSQAFKILPESKIFIEGNKLIDGISAKGAVSLREFKGKEIPLIITDIVSGQIVSNFSLDIKGEAYFDLTPTFGHQYVCILADSNSKFQLKLPEILQGGYHIKIISVDINNIVIKVEKNNIIDQNIEILVMSDYRVIDKKSLIPATLINNQSLSISSANGSIIEILLKDQSGNILATNAIFKEDLSTIQLQSMNKEYAAGEKINLNLLYNSTNLSDKLNASISIHKTSPKLIEYNENLLYNYNHLSYKKFSLNNSLSLVLPEFSKSDIYTGKSTKIDISDESVLPVEEIGIIYKGIAFDNKTNEPASDLKIVYSIKDTVPDLQSVVTNSNGQFALLVDHSDEQQTYINIFKDKAPVTDQYQIIFNKKFYYQKNSKPYTYIFQSADSNFISEIKNEAQRALIQKLFTQNNNEYPVSVSNKNLINSGYLSKNAIKVVIDDYFSMPNFEEIAREILPRVQYRYSKNGCSLAVIISEPEYKSYNPLVLLNGIPVEDICELYALNSEMIDRIYIQHEPRIVGNLLIDGMILILTVPDKKLKNFKTISNNMLKLPSYNICPLYDPLKVTKLTNSNNTLPDFRNQLYWNSIDLASGQSIPIEFNTSDEEGDYIVEICGYKNDGSSINYQETFTIKPKQ